MLLTLPRELRDEIYLYILHPQPSPSYIEALSPPIDPSAHTSFHTYKTAISTQRYSLYLSPHDPLHDDSPPSPRRPRTSTSLSLLRVNRQIHSETKSKFWNHNTLYFNTLSESNSPSHPGPIKLLKSIGQSASRTLISIRLNMGGPGCNIAPPYTTLPKLLTLLASRARHGAFKKLEIVWSREEFLFLLGPRERRKMLEGLCTGNERPGYERVARVGDLELDGDEDVEVLEEIGALGREIHACFGGRFYMGDELVWDMEKRVKVGVPISAFGYLKAKDVKWSIGQVELW